MTPIFGRIIRHISTQDMRFQFVLKMEKPAKLEDGMRSMYFSTLTKIAFLVVYSVVTTVAQTKPAESPKPVAAVPAPGNIYLPEEFIYERRQGIDSFVGAIVRSDGFTITHDIGSMAGNYADQYFPEHFEMLRKQTHLNSGAIERQVQYLQDKIEWRRRQKVNGADVMVVLLKDSTLIASFPDSNANFIAKIDSHDKVADFLLIVLTYQPKSSKGI